MRYMLLTDYGTLELPSEHCYDCIANMQFMGCTACPLAESLKKAANVVLNQLTKIINEEELE